MRGLMVCLEIGGVCKGGDVGGVARVTWAANRPTPNGAGHGSRRRSQPRELDMVERVQPTQACQAANATAASARACAYVNVDGGGRVQEQVRSAAYCGLPGRRAARDAARAAQPSAASVSAVSATRKGSGSAEGLASRSDETLSVCTIACGGAGRPRCVITRAASARRPAAGPAPLRSSAGRARRRGDRAARSRRARAGRPRPSWAWAG